MGNAAKVLIEKEHNFDKINLTESKIEKLFFGLFNTIKNTFLVAIAGVLLFVYIIAILLVLERFGAPLPTKVESFLKKVEFSAWVTAKEAQYQTDKFRHIK